MYSNLAVAQVDQQVGPHVAREVFAKAQVELELGLEQQLFIVLGPAAVAQVRALCELDEALPAPQYAGFAGARVFAQEQRVEVVVEEVVVVQEGGVLRGSARPAFLGGQRGGESQQEREQEQARGHVQSSAQVCRAWVVNCASVMFSRALPVFLLVYLAMST